MTPRQACPEFLKCHTEYCIRCGWEAEDHVVPAATTMTLHMEGKTMNKTHKFRIEFVDQDVLVVTAAKAFYERDWAEFQDASGEVVATVSAQRIKFVTSEADTPDPSV